MKKTILFLLFNICVLFCIQAQPILTAANNIPLVGTSYTPILCDSVASVGPSGANQTWDFSSLVTDSAQTSIFYENPLSTPYYSNFSLTNLVVVTYEGATEVYNYLYADSNELVEVGAASYAAIVTDAPQSVLMKYPFTYSSQWSDTSGGTSSQGVVVYEATTKTGDGYGTLMLLGVTYTDVLRVREVDSLTYDIPGAGTQIQNDTTYSWYDTLHREPLLSIEYIHAFVPNSGTYNYEQVYVYDLTTGIRSIAKTSLPFTLYPNPSSGIVNVSFNLQSEENVSYEVTNPLGQEISLHNDNNLSPGNHFYSLNNLSAGIYFLKLKAGNSEATQKFIVTE